MRILAQHPKMVFHGSLATLLLSGVGVIAIDGAMQTRRKQYFSALTEGLWKFTPEEERSRRIAGKVWQFRKLILLGVMLASFITAFATKFVPKNLNIFAGLFVSVAWTIFVNAYWYYYKESIVGDVKKASKDNGDNGGSDNDKSKPKPVGWCKRTLDVSASDSGLSGASRTGVCR